MPRVIVTRPAREAAHWVQQLRARGIEAAALPLIAIGPDTDPAAQQVLGQARQQLHQYRALMFVSGNAVVHFFKSNWPLALDGKALAAINSEANALTLTAVQWLIVPRHPQRFDEVHQLLQRAGLSVSRRSTWAGQPNAADVWLGDSLGEMALYYGLADVALLGGSFAPLGGQNLIEAAACGCPVVLGPHTFNFAEAAELACAAGAAQRVPDIGAGMERAVQLAQHADQQQAASERAMRFAQAHRGAAQAMVKAVLEIVQPGLSVAR